MENLRPYEEQILKEIRALPQEALPKLLRLLTVVRDEFLSSEQTKPPSPSHGSTSHEKTRQLLSTSTSNWAQDIIAEREDRL
jgi:hypothetical protein